MVVQIAFGMIAVSAAARMVFLQHRLRAATEQAIVDPLTGAYNRRHLNACLTAAVERYRRTGERASLLLFDVDRFKAINDAAGHAAGDRVLKALVALVRGRARKLDLLFRVGGDEFALLLADADFDEAVAVAENLRGLIAASPMVSERRVSVSIGVSDLRDWLSISNWIDEADLALYRAKRAGRNRVAGRHVDPAIPGSAHAVERRVRIHIAGVV